MPELSKFQRALISRGTLVVLALALLYGGYRAVHAGYTAQAEFDAKHPEYVRREEQGTSGAMIFYVVGGVLLLAGAFLGFMGVVSMATFGRVMGPPNLSTTPWDNSYPNEDR